MKKFGLDFGTTNSSISIVDVRGEVQVISIDEIAKDPRVVRSMLYFYPRKLVSIFGREKIKQFETFTSIAAGLAR